MTDIKTIMADLGQNAKDAAATLAYATAEAKSHALMTAADRVWARRAELIAANEKDLAYGREKGLSPAMMDRLMLDEARIAGYV